MWKREKGDISPTIRLAYDIKISSDERLGLKRITNRSARIFFLLLFHHMLYSIIFGMKTKKRAVFFREPKPINKVDKVEQSLSHNYAPEGKNKASAVASHEIGRKQPNEL